MANLKQQILEEVINTLEKRFSSEIIRSGELGEKCEKNLNTDTLCEFCKSTGKLSGLSESLSIVRDMWISAINYEEVAK